MAEENQIILIKKKAAHAGHHGGAWKVAYADFVTAMMALFIVLWLMNSSKPIQKPFRLSEIQSVVSKFRQEQKLKPVAAVLADVQFSDDDLRAAIAGNQFVMHFQPQVDVVSNVVVGVEALVRWQHPQLGLICPDHFIARAEGLHLIDALGWNVLRASLSAFPELASATPGTPLLAINVSTQSLHDLAFPDALISVLGSYGVAPHEVILEITETGLLDDLSSTLDVLTRLRMKGFLLSIDDFGTGYAMMQQLKRSPATELKIDRSFVKDMLDNYGDRIMVQKTIEMGHELGMKVIAEGVETIEQLNFLRSQHCDIAQGYYFSRALPSCELVHWLRAHTSSHGVAHGVSASR